CSFENALFGFLNPTSQQSGADYVSNIAFTVGVILAVLALTALVRQEAEARQNSKKMFYELKTKSKQLEDSYRKLKETAAMQEKMAILQERIRLSRDMHDTVGHALTNGLFTIEAVEKLMESGQKDTASNKISLAKEQLRKGLGELRKVVSTIATEPPEFFESIQNILGDMRRQGFSIYEDIGKLSKMGYYQQTALLRALQEGLTNGVKHGHSTAFVVRLIEDCGNIQFSLEDNGIGCEKLVLGFGLKSMKLRVTNAGGRLRIESPPGKGFLIEIIMPVEGMINETNTNSDR
ncbi:MAG: integral rane sensor signal transduction histidine kinase, partial [Clostridiales bacterium]|nr:integral rane sensor signal transduction histidine kinase [Clostridiales bacterium]